MCGIAGVSLSDTTAIVPEALLGTMGASLAHRGPDGNGMFVAGSLGLVHARLAVVDLAGGRQPFVAQTEAGEVSLVANGEIYNYRALEHGLNARGVASVSASDCEPVLHHYIFDGLPALDALEGMYGVVIADGRNGELVLARDPFGIKPLYYLEAEQGFAFASEPRALLALEWIQPVLREEAIPQLMDTHYVADDALLLAGVRRVLPGERLVVKAGKIVSRSTYAIPVLRAVAPAAVQSFGAEFEAAVARHIAPEVPMGLFLSGGIDSTAVLVALANLGVNVTTYTARFAAEPGTKIVLPAAELAQRYGMPHREVVYTRAKFWDNMVDMAWAMDDLTLDYAILPSLELARTAQADGMKVIFSGEGGDELLAGYRRFQRNPFQTLLRQYLRPGGGWHKMAPYMAEKMAYKPAKPARGRSGLSALQARQLESMTGGMANDLLPKLDRSLMRYGIEGRVPFLDDRFSSYAFNLPETLKLRDGYGKWVLRQYLADNGQQDIAWHAKQGFSVPIREWLTAEKALVAQIWNDSPFLQRLLADGAQARLLAALPDRSVVEPVFSLTALALWHAIHLEGRSMDELRAKMGASA